MGLTNGSQSGSDMLSDGFIYKTEKQYYKKYE